MEKPIVSGIALDKNQVRVGMYGVIDRPGVASKAFTALANENINIRIISTSEIKISMIIDEKYAELAVRALHDAYHLDK